MGSQRAETFHEGNRYNPALDAMQIPLRYYLRAVAGEITFEEAEEQTRNWADDLEQIERDDQVIAKAEKEEE